LALEEAVVEAAEEAVAAEAAILAAVLEAPVEEVEVAVLAVMELEEEAAAEAAEAAEAAMAEAVVLIAEQVEREALEDCLEEPDPVVLLNLVVLAGAEQDSEGRFLSPEMVHYRLILK
jgi:hypothetical protein